MGLQRRMVLRIVLPLLVTAGVFLFFFRGMTLADIRQAFAEISGGALLLFALLSLAGTFLRMLRFSILLSGRIEKKRLFLITLVHNFSVDLLPARTAALGFYGYLTHREGVEWEDGAGSFVSAILYDVLAVSILLLPGVVFIGKEVVNPWVLAGALALLVSLSWALLLLAPIALQWLQPRTGMSHPRFAAVLARAHAYFLVHKKGSERLLLLGQSILIKFVKYLSVFVLLRNLVPQAAWLSSFFTFSFGVAAAEVAAYLPVHGLAGFGTWEAAFASAVRVLQLEIPAPGVGPIAWAVHITTQVWEYSIGLIAFLWLFWKKKRNSGQDI